MLGIFADFLASIATILFPVFASYKALRTSDPAQLTPWLIYWVILSLILLVESWTVFIIGWLPFYSWIRLFALSYLVLPQTQGAKLLYTNFVEPFIAKHEHQIELFIGDLHEKGTNAGLGYLKQAVNLIRERVLGFPPAREEEQQAAPPAAAGYAQSLLSRFAMPSARAPSTSDFYGMLSAAVAATTSPSSTMRAPGGLRSADVDVNSTKQYPTGITTNADKHSFLTSQREKLAVLMRALDHEERDLDLAYGSTAEAEKALEADVDRRMRAPGSFRGQGQGAGQETDGEGVQMGKSRSNTSFQNIEHDELDDEDVQGNVGSQAAEKTTKSSSSRAKGGWSAVSWFGRGEGLTSARDDPGDGVAEEVREAVRGMSSSIDRNP